MHTSFFAAFTLLTASQEPAPEITYARAEVAGTGGPIRIVNGGLSERPSAWLVQLGAFSSEIRAEHAWQTFQDRYRDILDGAREEYHSARLPDGGMIIRLRVSGFANRDQADTACEALREHDEDCFVLRRP